MPETDGLVTLRERVRRKLARLIRTTIAANDGQGVADSVGELDLADAIMREFALRPVASGKVGDGGEVEPI